MKKLIPILAIILISCGKNSPKAGFTITSIKYSKYESKCAYYGRPTVITGLFTPDEAVIYDTCGKFNIGDIIKFVK